MTSALAFVRELFHESTLGDVLADACGKAVQVPAAITTGGPRALARPDHDHLRRALGQRPGRPTPRS